MNDPRPRNPSTTASTDAAASDGLRGFDMTGKVVIVTGGAGLVGRGYVRTLTAAGAHVVSTDIRPLTDSDPPDDVERHTLDVTDPDAVAGMVDAVAARHGRIDGLVNNASLDPKFDVGTAGEHTTAFEDYPLDRWRRTLSVDLDGAFLCCRAVGKVMHARGSGSIVNVSSVYGHVAPDQRLYVDPDRPDAPPLYKPADYCVAKAGVAQLTRYLAAYGAGTGIRVNTLTLAGVHANQSEGFRERFGERLPMGRMAEQGEYDAAVLFLLSEASGFMTGSDLRLDGGWTAW